jgi:hypothetical protein
LPDVRRTNRFMKIVSNLSEQQTSCGENLNESSPARNWSLEAGGSLAARQEERVRRKEPEEVFLQI